MSKVMDLTGHVYGRLTVLSGLEPQVKPAKWTCLCDCGNTKIATGSAMRNGTTKSCGCLHIDRNKEMFTTHGGYKTKLFAVYQQMLIRCRYDGHKSYALYGGRGIKVCDDWQEYLTFKSWAEAHGYAEGLSIDRKDPDGNYEPNNCRWVNQTTQTRNRRKQDNKSSPFIGVTWDSSRKKWLSCVGVGNKTIALGRYVCATEAAKARDNYIIQNKLEDFVLNFN